MRDADEILVLEQGRVVERGPHDALIAAGGRYCALWSQQAHRNGGAPAAAGGAEPAEPAGAGTGAAAAASSAAPAPAAPVPTPAAPAL